MPFQVNLLSQPEKDILSFMAKYRDFRIARFESMDNDMLQAMGDMQTGIVERMSINSPSFDRLFLSHLIKRSDGALFFITHDGIECVQAYEQ